MGNFFRSLLRAADKIIEWVSGEFMLRVISNGGTAVLLRSLLVTFVISVLVLPLKYYCEGHELSTLSLHQIRLEFGAMLTWIGAIFAAAYVALYSRFAAQWNYLANLYNQITQTCVGKSDDEREIDKVLLIWRSALMEDAQDLHLAGKSMFRSVIKAYLDKREIVTTFLESTEEPYDRLYRIIKTVGYTGVVAQGCAAEHAEKDRKPLETQKQLAILSQRDFKDAQRKLEAHCKRIRSEGKAVRKLITK